MAVRYTSPFQMCMRLRSSAMPPKFFKCLPAAACIAASIVSLGQLSTASAAETKFHLQEATIDAIQSAILSKQITTKELVELYLKRIKAYNGTCVKHPQGLLGPIETIPNAGQLNALQTLNLRP